MQPRHSRFSYLLLLAGLLAGSVLLSGNPLPEYLVAQANVPAILAKPPTSRWPACDAKATRQKISFVHVSDVHAHYNPDAEGIPPVARLRGIYEQTRRENPFTLFTDGGDDYEKGSIAEALSEGETTRRVVRAMGYDIRTLGNHDFAWSLPELLAFSHDPTAAVLAANVRMVGPSPGEEPGWQGYVERQVGCLRVGFFGLTPRPWNEKDEPYDDNFYPELESRFDFVTQTREIIAAHRREVDLLVLVSHLGIDDDIRIARETQGVDLILGGHTHTLLEQPMEIGGSRIVHVGAQAEYAGRMALDFDLKARRLLGYDFTLIPAAAAAPDFDMVATVETILLPYREAFTTQFTQVNDFLDRDAVAQLAARAAVESLGIDAALVAPHTVWDEWAPGGLTQQQVLDTLAVEREPVGQPGFSSLYRLEVSGDDLLLARRQMAGAAYWGPQRVDPARRYTLAVQKAPAYHQRHYFGREIGRRPPQPATELWQAVVKLGRARNEQRLAIDEAAVGDGAG